MVGKIQSNDQPNLSRGRLPVKRPRKRTPLSILILRPAWISLLRRILQPWRRRGCSLRRGFRLLAFEFDLELLVEPESLLPGLNSMPRLLGSFFVPAKIKNQKRMCHARILAGDAPCVKTGRWERFRAIMRRADRPSRRAPIFRQLIDPRFLATAVASSYASQVGSTAMGGPLEIG